MKFRRTNKVGKFEVKKVKIEGAVSKNVVRVAITPRKKKEIEMVSHTPENRLSHRCRIRTAGVRTFDIRTLVSFALLPLSHCWHSHCWLRTGVVRTFVFRTLVGIPVSRYKVIHKNGRLRKFNRGREI